MRIGGFRISNEIQEFAVAEKQLVLLYDEEHLRHAVNRIRQRKGFLDECFERFAIGGEPFNLGGDFLLSSHIDRSFRNVAAKQYSSN
jgi:hypothetical protein